MSERAERRDGAWDDAPLTVELELAEHLRSLEEELLQASTRHNGTRRNGSRLQALLAPEFQEFGSSGRIWDRAGILAELASEEARSLVACDFQLTRLAADVVLVTYRLRASGAHSGSLRSSIWRRREGVWQLVFHQGTHTAAPADPIEPAG